MRPICQRFLAAVHSAVAGGMLLSACGTPTTPGATARIVATLQATPTPRVLARADQPANAVPLEPPPGRDERDSIDVTPDYEEAVRALPQVGSPTPDFTLRTLDGVTITLSSLRGRPVLINFWASWCLPCREEAPGAAAAV